MKWDDFSSRKKSAAGCRDSISGYCSVDGFSALQLPIWSLLLKQERVFIAVSILCLIKLMDLLLCVLEDFIQSEEKPCHIMVDRKAVKKEEEAQN